MKAIDIWKKESIERAKPIKFYEQQKIAIADFYYWKDVEKFMKKIDKTHIDKKEVLKAMVTVENDLVNKVVDKKLELQDINTIMKWFMKQLELDK